MPFSRYSPTKLDEIEHLHAKLLATDPANIDAGEARGLVCALREANAKAALYEKLRKLNPTQFTQLHKRNLAGEGSFDDLVHALPD